MGYTNDMIANIIFICIKVFTILGTTSFIVAGFCPYIAGPFKDRKEYFMYMAKAYIHASLVLIIVHIILTKP